MSETLPQNSVGPGRPPVEYQFQPGQSGNPGGRPKTKKQTEAYDRLSDMPPEELAAYEPKDSWEATAKVARMRANQGSISAAKEITDRVEGRAKETVEHQGAIDLGEMIAEAARTARERRGR